MFFKNKKAKRNKYYKFSFKLSTNKSEELKNIAKNQKSTPNKIIKKAIYEFIKQNQNSSHLLPKINIDNQMNIFDIIDNE
ncbi:MAG TPA: uL13 family ribosomal protein [Bacteroidales bacterium]|nr:uL13 family ribosomal protein [Bacteroidales bacterium]